MKTKSIVVSLIVIAAIATLSFTFSSTNHGQSKKIASEERIDNAPAGGIGIEE